MSKETTETIKYKFEFDNTEILNTLDKIRIILDGSKDIISDFQKSFINFSTKTFISELDKLRMKQGVSSSTNWSDAKENLKISLKDKQNKNSKDTALFENWQNSVTEYATIGNNAFGDVLGPALGIVKMLEDSVDIKLFGDIVGKKGHFESLSTVILELSSVTETFANNLLSSYDTITQNLSKESALIDNHKALASELKTIVDENGNVKAGYEDRAQFIVSVLNDAYGVEMSLINGTIKNYKTEIQSVEDIIETKKQEMALNASEKQYQLALETKVETYKNLKKAEEEHNFALNKQKEIENEINEQYNKGKGKKGESLEEFTKRMIGENEYYQQVTDLAIKTQETLNVSQAAYDANVQARMNYQGLQTAIANKDAEAIEYYTNRIANSYYDGKNMITFTQEEMLDETKLYHNKVYDLTEEENLKIADSLKRGADYALESTRSCLLEQTTSVESLTPSVVEAWGELSKGSTEEFLEYFNKIPENVRQNIIDKMEQQGFDISSELEKGLKENNPEIVIKSKAEKATVLIDANTKEAERKTNSWLKGILESITGGAWILKKEFGGVYANGSWSNIPQFANGGLPNHGTMFIAGESGAEIVGHINGRTEVLNKSQIASAIYTAVAAAMSQYSRSSQEIRVYAEEGLIVEKVSKGINQHVKQTGSLPFIIPI